MLLIITILLSLVSIMWVTIRYFYSIKNDDEKKNSLLNFLFADKVSDHMLTFLITVVGVTLALLLTNADTLTKNRSSVVQFLNAISDEYAYVVRYIEEYYIPGIEQLKEQGADEEQIFSWYNSLPLTPVGAYSNILNSELVITNMSYPTYSALVYSYKSDTAAFERLLTADSVDGLVSGLKTIRANMQYNIELIDIEVTKSNENDSEIQRKVQEHYANYVRDYSRYFDFEPTSSVIQIEIPE